MPPFPSSALAKAINRVNKELSFPLPESLELPMEPSDYETLDEIRTSFRASGDDISRVRTLLKKYEGTHDFHNYTIGREFGDSSSKRYMINIDVISVLFLLHRKHVLITHFRSESPACMMEWNGLV